MIRSKEALSLLQEELQSNIRLRNLGEATTETTDVLVRVGEDAAGISLIHAFLDQVTASQLEHVRIIGVDLLETDKPHAAKIIEPNGRGSLYIDLDAEKINKIVASHLVGSMPVEEYLDR